MKQSNAWSAALGLLIVALTVASPHAGAQGKLDAFESDATTRRSYHDHDRDRHDESCVSFLFSELAAEILYIGVGYGGVGSWERMAGGTVTDMPIRSMGEPGLPVFRLDGAYQWLTSDIEALDARFEGGYGPIGLEIRATHMQEDSPNDDLDFVRWHVLYRMSFGPHLEVDLGMGSWTISGNETHSGFSTTVPVRLYPVPWAGLELRPAWADINGNTIADYELGVVLGPGYVSLRAGYRWTLSPGESLQGPYAGLSLHF